jgi:exopolyphosphatase/guanosine-5'-triphosphate,3'-diphosphate pyrophosphatase
VRFTERHGEDVERIAAETRALLPALEPGTAIGVAGTLTTLAALDLGLEHYDRARVDGHRLSRRAAHEQRDRLASLTVEERAALPAMEPQRAPVIVAGASILVAVLDAYDLDAIEVSERDILDGIALTAAELPAPEEGSAPPGAFTCC